MQAITIGLDIAKSVFQVHAVDAGGQVVIRRQLKRRYVLALVAMRLRMTKVRRVKPHSKP
jgi:transposase